MAKEFAKISFFSSTLFVWLRLSIIYFDSLKKVEKLENALREKNLIKNFGMMYHHAKFQFKRSSREKVDFFVRSPYE